MTIYGIMDGYHGDEQETDARQWLQEERQYKEQSDVEPFDYDLPSWEDENA